MKTNMKGWMYVFALAALVGVSGSAFAQRGDGRQGGRGHIGFDKKDATARNDAKRSFAGRIYRITESDSLQVIRMKPIVDRTSKRLDALRASFARQEKRVMDSLSLQLKPILKEEQMKRLEDFNYHNQERFRKK